MKNAKANTRTTMSTATAAAAVPPVAENGNGDTADRRAAMQELLATYAACVNSGDTTSRHYADTLNTLAHTIAYGVLKKVYSASGNAQMMDYRRDIAAATSNESRRQNAIEGAAHYVRKEDGDIKRVIDDRDLNAALVKLSAYVCGDGCDLVSVAAVAVLESTAAQRDREPDEPCDLERVYIKRVLDKRVLIQDKDSAAYRDEETAPIRECYRAVRRYVLNNATPTKRKYNKNTGKYEAYESKYIYLDASAECEDGDTAAVELYRRYSVYAGMDGKITNGTTAAAITDTADTADLSELVARMGLTEKENEVLCLRLRGAGNKAIARYRGVSEDTVRELVKRIRKKAVAVGYDIAAATTAESDTTAAALYLECTADTDTDTADTTTDTTDTTADTATDTTTAAHSINTADNVRKLYYTMLANW